MDAELVPRSERYRLPSAYTYQRPGIIPRGVDKCCKEADYRPPVEPLVPDVPDPVLPVEPLSELPVVPVGPEGPDGPGAPAGPEGPAGPAGPGVPAGPCDGTTIVVGGAGADGDCTVTLGAAAVTVCDGAYQKKYPSNNATTSTVITIATGAQPLSPGSRVYVLIWVSLLF